MFSKVAIATALTALWGMLLWSGVHVVLDAVDAVDARYRAGQDPAIATRQD